MPKQRLVLGEGMARHVKPQDGLFVFQQLALRPFGDVGEGLFLGGGIGRQLTEEVHLASAAVLLGGGAGREGPVHDGGQLASPCAGRIECPALDEAVDDRAVDGRGVHVLREVKEGAESSDPAPGGLDGLDGPMADALDGRQAEPHAVADDREVGPRFVDVGGGDLNAHASALVDVFGDLVGVGHFVGQKGGHELHRIVDLQVGRLVGDLGVAGGVALVEPVAAEVRDELPDFLGDAGAEAMFPGAGEESVAFGLDNVAVLLGDGLDEFVRPLQGDAAQAVRHPHDLFLVGHDPVRLFQNFLQHRMRVIVGDAAVLAIQERIDHDHRAGAVEGVGGDEVFEFVGADFLEEVPHAGGFKLEDALRFTPLEQAEDRRVVQGDLLEVHGLAAVLAHEVHRPLHGREGPQAQEVHLQEAHFADRAHLPLGGDVVADSAEGDVAHERGVGDHHTRRVHRRVARQALQTPRNVHQVADLRLGLDEARQVRLLLKRPFERHVKLDRDKFGDAVDFGQGHVEDAADVAHHRPRRHCSERDDLRDVLLAVFLMYVADDVLPTVLADVDVQVGHFVAARVHEPLEQQAVPDRVYARQA